MRILLQGGVVWDPFQTVFMGPLKHIIVLIMILFII